MNFITNPHNSQEKPTWPRRRPLHLTPWGFTQTLKRQKNARTRCEAEKKGKPQRVVGPDTATADLHDLPMSESSTFKPTEPWYHTLRKARIAFSTHSGEELELLSNTYQGDDHRHHVHHRSCEHQSWISLREIKALSPGTWCPHCHGADDLMRFGSIDDVRDSVYHGSGGSVFFFPSNNLGSGNDFYAFWCLRHSRSYETTFWNFHRDRGNSNACPLCKQEERPGEEQ